MRRAYRNLLPVPEGKDGEGLLTWACGDRTRANDFKLKEGKFKIDIREKSLMWEWWCIGTGRSFCDSILDSRILTHITEDGSKATTLETEGCTGSSSPYMLQFIRMCFCCPKERKTFVWLQGACTKDGYKIIMYIPHKRGKKQDLPFQTVYKPFHVPFSSVSEAKKMWVFI